MEGGHVAGVPGEGTGSLPGGDNYLNILGIMSSGG